MPKILLFVLPALVGCTAAVGLPPLRPDNPASPEAAEAKLPAMSDTLRLPEPKRSARADERKPSAVEAMSSGHGGGHGHQ